MSTTEFQGVGNGLATSMNFTQQDQNSQSQLIEDNQTEMNEIINNELIQSMQSGIPQIEIVQRSESIEEEKNNKEFIDRAYSVQVPTNQ